MCEMTHEHPHSNVLTALIAELDEELRKIYGKAQLESDPFNQLAADDIALVAWVGGEAVACGAYRSVSTRADVVEIKRMYVRPSSRRKGIAMKLLSQLEQHAAENGYRKAQLETGTSQPDAIALYQRQGYIRIANFPPYTDKTNSVCMEKLLS